MKYIIAIALMFAIALPVFASESLVTLSATEAPSVSDTVAVTNTTDLSTGNGNKADTDEPTVTPSGRKSSSGSYAMSIQDKIFALTGVRFEKTNDPRMIEIYKTLYQILLALKTV